MRILSVHALFLAVAALVSGADDGPVKFPVRPVVPQPMPPAPAPVPGAPFMVTGDLLYVIDCKAECVLRAHPAKLVNVAKLKGPVSIFGKFVDGTGHLEQRTYTGQSVFVITAGGIGTVELDVIPLGFKSEAEIATATIQVDSHGPRPPPEPDPKPPEPKPPVVTSFRVIWVFESGDTIPANQTAVMDAKAVREYLSAKTTKEGGWAGWRQFDPQTLAANETPNMKALWQAVQPKLTAIPCLVVEVNGKADILPFPKTPADALAVLKQYGGP